MLILHNSIVGIFGIYVGAIQLFGASYMIMAICTSGARVDTITEALEQGTNYWVCLPEIMSSLISWKLECIVPISYNHCIKAQLIEVIITVRHIKKAIL